MRRVAWARTAVCAVVLSALALSVRPAGAEVQIGQVRTGYEGHGRTGCPMPVTVDLTNPDSGDVRGVLSIRQPIERSQPLVWSREVEMPAGAHKQVTLYPACPDDAYRSSQNAATVVFQPRRGPEISRPLEVHRHGSDTLLLQVCTEGPVGSFSVAQMIDTARWVAKAPAPAPGAPPRPSSPAGARAEVVVAYTNTEGLPDSWKGFEGLDLLILDDFSTQAISPAQEAAILDWVSAGGRLLVTGGEDYQRLSASFLKDYLPLSITGSEVLPALPELQRAFGGELNAAPAAIVVGNPARGSIHLSQDGRPLVCSCTVGLGKVWLTTFSFTNQPVRGWDGAAELLSKILRTDRQYPAALVGAHASQVIANGLAVNAGAKPPSFRVISIFLLAYIIFLIPVNYLVLKRLDRRELAWATTPCIVVVFSFAAYGLGFVLRGNATVLRSAGMVEVQASTGAGIAQSYYSLFSPRRAEYSLSFAAPSVETAVPSTAQPNWRGRTEPQKLNSAFEVRSGAQDSVHKLLVQMWDQRVFETAAPVVLDGPLAGDLRLERGNRVTGQLTNDTGLPLQGAVLVFRRVAYAVGDLAAGEGKPIDWTAGFVPAPQDPDPGRYRGASEDQPGYRSYGGPSASPVPPGGTVGSVVQALLKGPERREGRMTVEDPLYVALREGYLSRTGFGLSDREALLLAWTTTDPLAATVAGRKPKAESVTLAAFHIAVQGE